MTRSLHNGYQAFREIFLFVIIVGEVPERRVGVYLVIVYEVGNLVYYMGAF